MVSKPYPPKVRGLSAAELEKRQARVESPCVVAGTRRAGAGRRDAHDAAEAAHRAPAAHGSPSGTRGSEKARSSATWHHYNRDGVQLGVKVPLYRCQQVRVQRVDQCAEDDEARFGCHAVLSQTGRRRCS